MDRKASTAIMQARTSLVLGNPFFGSLVLRLKMKEDGTCETAWTDGQSMGYSPKFINSLPQTEIKALLAHEVWHCAAGHPWRREGRDHKQWNIACDLSINGRLKACGFDVPANGLFPDAEQDGKSAEWIFARMPKPDPSSQGNGKPNPQGEVRDAPGEGDADGDVPTEETWKQAVIQAEIQAKMQGAMPAGVARLCDESKKSHVDWKAILRRFISEQARADYSWQRPNRRYMSQGLYLPSLKSEAMGGIAVAIDTSGSVDSAMLAAAKAELDAVIEDVQPSFVTVYYADSAVQHTDHFTRGESVEWRPKGGGGTDFRPVFRACEEAEYPPICLVYITDLYGTMPADENVPVLWVTNNENVTVPFGEIVRIE